MFEEINHSHPDLDVLMLNGDYVAHGVAAYPNQKPNFDKLKEILSGVFTPIREKFGSIPIVPTIGNNDPVWHNQFPSDKDLSEEYYEFLYDLWFNKHPANQKFRDTEGLAGFKTGGYYAIKVEDTLFISLNTLNWDKDSKDLDHHGVDTA